MLLTNVLRVGFSILFIIQSGAETEYAYCMHEKDYWEALEICSPFGINSAWKFFIDSPIIAILLSFTDLITIPLLKVIC